MLTNPKVSLHFPWNVLERQVRVTGVAQLLERNEVDDYFHRRPRESQLAAWASRQSQPIASRAALMARYQSTEERFAGGDRKSTRLNSSHVAISYAVFCLKNKKK